MTGAEFDTWFKANLSLMVSLGVMHPNSALGRALHLAVAAVDPRITALEARVAALEGKPLPKPKSAPRKKAGTTDA